MKFVDYLQKYLKLQGHISGFHFLHFDKIS